MFETGRVIFKSGRSLFEGKPGGTNFIHESILERMMTKPVGSIGPDYMANRVPNCVKYITTHASFKSTGCDTRPTLPRDKFWDPVAGKRQDPHRTPRPPAAGFIWSAVMRRATRFSRLRDVGSAESPLCDQAERGARSQANRPPLGRYSPRRRGGAGGIEIAEERCQAPSQSLSARVESVPGSVTIQKHSSLMRGTSSRVGATRATARRVYDVNCDGARRRHKTSPGSVTGSPGPGGAGRPGARPPGAARRR